MPLCASNVGKHLTCPLYVTRFTLDLHTRGFPRPSGPIVFRYRALSLAIESRFPRFCDSSYRYVYSSRSTIRQKPDRGPSKLKLYSGRRAMITGGGKEWELATVCHNLKVGGGGRAGASAPVNPTFVERRPSFLPAPRT